MNALTQPIRVIFNTREKGYRVKTWVASAAIFTLLAGDSLRYSVGWYGWGVVLGLFTGMIVARFGFRKLEGVVMPPPTNPDRVLGLDLVRGAWNGVTGPVTRARA